METKLNSKLNLNIDADVVIERLQLDGVFECDRIPQHLVKQALSKWLSKIEDSINNEPDWWIRQFESKAFKSSIESFLDDYSEDIEGTDSQDSKSEEKDIEFAALS